jgi:hypothetical protein
MRDGKITNMSARGRAASLCLSNPWGGRRYVVASERRTKQDWAREVKSIVTEQYPRAEKVVLVMENLNTHTLSSLYEAFPAAEALEIVQKLEIHYTPKHGSWLNRAEIELSAMTSQCLNRRIDTLGHYDGYTQEDFDTLLALLGSLKGRFLLSSFRNEVLDKHVKRKGWHSIEIGMYCAMTNRYESRRGKVEVLTANYPIKAADKPSRTAVKET